MSKIISFSQIQEIESLALPRVSTTRKLIVHCHGVFDILHAGHLAYFESAKAHGDLLVVTITADRFVNKGPGKPVFTEDIRAQMLAALEIVDFVAISDYPTAIQAIETLKPDFYVKGPDYRDRTKDVTGEIYNEEAAVKRHGGQIVFTEDETFSSSTLANRFFVKWTDEQEKCIRRIKELGGMDKIESMLEDISKLNVMVIGEPILDVYRFVEPQNISSKSPSISTKFLYEEEYEGGAWAIENHLKTFCKVEMLPVDYDQVPTKIRYIAGNQRMLEVTLMPAYLGNNLWPDEIVADMAIIADFGHGLFEETFLKMCERITCFKALMAQTNSSNMPFNPYHKHERFDYLAIDTREMRIAFHDNKSTPIELGRKARRHAEVPVSMTAGSNGAFLFHRENDYFAPAFADNVVDATGAGDAYFAITSLLVKVGAPPEMVPFLGNVFAGLKTKIIGNKSAVSKAQLIKALTGILK